MFQTSLEKISAGFLSKLGELSNKTVEIAGNTEFLKKMRVIYDEQNNKLEIMDATINEVLERLDDISSGKNSVSDKKKKKKKK